MTRFGGALVGATFFLWIAGFRPLDPTEIGWLMRFDWPIHFFGWHFFRSEPWQLPPGLIRDYYFPHGTSIGFTDSIPLVAFLLKPFHAWLPATFQYLGLWLLACFTLQGAFGATLMRIWTDRLPLQLAGAAFFVLMPSLLVRVGHPALCSHWLLLWALAAGLRRKTGHGPGEAVGIGLIAGLVHPYLAVMALALLAGGSLAATVSWARRATLAAAAAGATVAGWWLAGLFSVAGSDSMGQEGLGHYSMNLLGPFSPTGGWSPWLPEWPRATSGQDFDGLHYFGLGGFIVIGLAAVLALRDWRALPWRRVGPLFVVCSAMAVYSLSPRVTLGGQVLVDLVGPWTEPLAVFRATGRFFWPLAHLVLASSLAMVITRLQPRVALATLAAAVLIQLIEFHGAHMLRRNDAHNPDFYAWNQPLVSGAWAAAFPYYRHLVLYPPAQCGPAPMPYEPAAYLAGLHGLTLNAGVVARPDRAAQMTYCRNLGDTIKAGVIDDRSFYIMLPSEVAALRAVARPPAVCGVIDNLSVCVTAASYQRWRDAATLQ